MIEINEIIKKRLWKRSTADFQLLETQIINEGCRDALVLWNDILIDGHNRYAICQKHNIPFKTEQMEFDNMEDCLIWIDVNQLSRRNLTDEQRTILYGRISKMNKLPTGVNSTNTIVKGIQKTADDLKIGVSTLKRAERYTEAIDELTENLGEELVDKILNRDIKLTRDEVIKIGKVTPSEQKSVLDKLTSGVKYHSATAALKEVVKTTQLDARRQAIDIPANIRCYNDDCRNVIKDLEDDSVDMLLTDPPYGIDFKPSHSPNKGFTDDSEENISIVLEDCCKIWQKKLKKDAHLYIFSGWGGYPNFKSILEKYFDISNVLIWSKNSNGVCNFDKRYAFCYEMIIFLRQKGLESHEERMLNQKFSKDVLNFNSVTDTDHSCAKPVELLEYLINNSTVEGETVLDCFAGSFNSAIAAKNTKRNYIGIELDKKWFDVGQLKI